MTNFIHRGRKHLQAFFVFYINRQFSVQKLEDLLKKLDWIIPFKHFLSFNPICYILNDWTPDSQSIDSSCLKQFHSWGGLREV